MGSSLARRLTRGAAWGIVAMAIALAACLPARKGEPAHGPCPAGDPLRGVYDPTRLHVLDTCVTYVGTVRDLRHEADGDYHLYVIPGSGMDRFLDDRSRQYGDLVVELLPGQRLPLPRPGQRVAFVGTWAYDTNHGWNEIHPVWAERVAGRLHEALPPDPPRYRGRSTV